MEGQTRRGTLSWAVPLFLGLALIVVALAMLLGHSSSASPAQPQEPPQAIQQEPPQEIQQEPPSSPIVTPEI